MPEQLENFQVLRKAKDVVKMAYQETRDFPKEETYGLTNQIRRAAVSIVANIAEGKGRQYTKEYVQFLYMARGSGYEMITLMELAMEMGLITQERTGMIVKACEEILAILNSIIKRFR